MSRQQRVLLSAIQRGLRPPRVDQEEYVRRVLFGGVGENGPGEEESERGETLASTQLRGFLVACIVPALTIVPYGEYEGWPLRAREDVLRAVESFAFVSENGDTGKPKMTRAQMLGLVSFLYRMPRVYLEEEGKGYGSERSVHGLRWFMSEMAPFFSEHVLWVLAKKVRVSLSNEEKKAEEEEEEFSEADERDAVQSAVTGRSMVMASYLVPPVEHASFFAMGEEKARDQVKRALLGLVVPVIAVLPPLKWVVGVCPDVFDVARVGSFEMTTAGKELVPRLPSVGVELAHVQYAVWVIMEMLDDDERLQLLSCLAGVEVYGKGFSRSMGERFRMHVATGALTALGTVF